jgi:hypothetical protein
MASYCNSKLLGWKRGLTSFVSPITKLLIQVGGLCSRSSEKNIRIESPHMALKGSELYSNKACNRMLLMVCLTLQIKYSMLHAFILVCIYVCVVRFNM